MKQDLKHPSGAHTREIVEWHDFNVACALSLLLACGLRRGTDDLPDLRQARDAIDHEIQRLESLSIAHDLAESLEDDPDADEREEVGRW